MSAEHRPSDHAASIAPAARAAPGATDYDAILAAVMETERGRWFLSEYASRNRRADTAEVLTAIDRLAARHAASVAARQPEEKPHEADVADDRRATALAGGLADLAGAIARTLGEIAALGHDAQHPAGDRGEEAREPLDAIVRTNERVVADIRTAAEAIQDVAWSMREQGMESAFCDQLDRLSAAMRSAGASQDLGGQGTRKLIHILRYVEARIRALQGLCATVPTADEVQTPSAAAPGPSEEVADADQPAHAAPAAVPVAVAEPIAASTPLPIAGSAAPPAVAPPREESPPLTAPVAAQAATQVPAQVPAKVPTHMMEGPAGSFSIGGNRPVDPQASPEPQHPLAPQQAEVRLQGAKAPSQEPEPPSQEPEASSQRPETTIEEAAAPRVATAAPPGEEPEARQQPAAPGGAQLSGATASLPPPDEANPIVANLRALAANLVAEFGRDSADTDTKLAVTKAAAAPPRPSDLAENMFADVMALTDEERIALFT